MSKLQTYNRLSRGKGVTSYAVLSAGNDIDKELHKKPDYEKMALHILGLDKNGKEFCHEKTLSCGDS